MTSNLWLEFIGASISHFISASRLKDDISDGQKRPVFIYRFLTAGTIDGMQKFAHIDGIRLTFENSCRKDFSASSHETRSEQL